MTLDECCAAKKLRRVTAEAARRALDGVSQAGAQQGAQPRRQVLDVPLGGVILDPLYGWTQREDEMPKAGLRISLSTAR